MSDRDSDDRSSGGSYASESSVEARHRRKHQKRRRKRRRIERDETSATSSEDASIERKDRRKSSKRKRRKHRKKRSKSYTSDDDDDDSGAAASSEGSSSYEHKRRKRRSKKRRKKKHHSRSRDKSRRRRQSDVDKGPPESIVATIEHSEPIPAANPIPGGTNEIGTRLSTGTEAPSALEIGNSEPDLEKAKKARMMAPMSRDQYEKQQSQVREVYDEETGRYRLVRGSGEIIERIVSRTDHERINQAATRGDGLSFARSVAAARSSQR